MILIRAGLLLFPILGTATHAFQLVASPTTTKRTTTTTTQRPARVYLPNGEAIDDSLLETENDETIYQPSSLVEHLNNNPDDFRGPMAVLAAAHSSVEITSIVGLAAVGANEEHLVVDVIAAADDQNCVKVEVTIPFPEKVPSSTDAERLDALNAMYPSALQVIQAKENQEKEDDEETTQEFVSASGAQEQEPGDIMQSSDAEDVSVPYDAAAQLAYEKSDKSMEYKEFKEKFEQDAVADVIAKNRGDSESRDLTVKEEPKTKATESSVKRKKEDPQEDIEKKKEQEYKQRQILMARLAAQQKQWEEQKAAEEARRQPKSPEDEARLAAKYAAIDDIGERAFTILVDLNMIQPTTDDNE